jgi:hypothetical protein
VVDDKARNMMILMTLTLRKHLESPLTYNNLLEI